MKRLLLALLVAAVAVIALSRRNEDRDITIGLSKDGCDVLDVMKVPATATGDEAAPCRLEHADITSTSALGGYMYHIEYGGFEFDIAKGFVVWKEKNGTKRQTSN